jgi:hypothetical protein
MQVSHRFARIIKLPQGYYWRLDAARVQGEATVTMHTKVTDERGTQLPVESADSGASNTPSFCIPSILGRSKMRLRPTTVEGETELVTSWLPSQMGTT